MLFLMELKVLLHQNTWLKKMDLSAKIDEKLEFKVIEFNKSAKRIILSHSRVFEDVKKAEEEASKKSK